MNVYKTPPNRKTKTAGELSNLRVRVRVKVRVKVVIAAKLSPISLKLAVNVCLTTI